MSRILVEGRLGSLHRAARGTDEVSVRIFAGQAPDPATLERMHEEALRCGRLGHPNIAAASEVGIAPDGQLYAVLEPLAGKDLATLLRTERRLDGGRAMDIAVQVARALSAAHSVGVLHLRLEPERVMVSPGTEPVRVLDLGLDPGAGRSPASDAESLLYRAPEQLAGGAVDVRTDVYGVAALLYELITGAPPHAGSADPGARKRGEPVQSPRMFRPEMPVEIERLLLAGLERDPALRPATMAAFEQGLVTASRGAASPSAAPGRPGTPPTAEDRRRIRREAAFRVIGELLAPPGSPAASSPSPSPERFPSSPALPAVRLPAAPQPAPRLPRGAYALALIGSLSVAAALAWRFLR